MSNKKFILYYNEPKDPEIIQPNHGPGDPSGHGHGHGHEIQPSHGNHMIHHNDTAITDYDFSYLIINIAFNLLFFLVFVELVKRCYIRCMIINQPPNRRRLHIEEEGGVKYSHNRVVIRDIVKEDICPICLEELFPEDVENANEVIELKCNHMFHKGCLDPWIKINKNCPLCKNNV